MQCELILYKEQVPQTEVFKIGEHMIDDLLVYLYQVLRQDPPEQFKDDLNQSYCKFDFDLDKVIGLQQVLKVKQEDSEELIDQYELYTEASLLDQLGKINPCWQEAELYEA